MFYLNPIEQLLHLKSFYDYFLIFLNQVNILSIMNLLIKICSSLHSILLYYCICCLLGSWLRLFHSSLRLPYEWCICCIKTKSYIVRWFFFNLPFCIDIIKICLLFVTIYTFFQRNTNKNCFFLGANADRHKYYQNNQKYWRNNCPYQP